MSVYLTKSRYVTGLHCERRLWLSVHRPRPRIPPAAGTPQDIGQDIGRYAHHLFDGGVLVEEQPWEHAAAMARTQALMADPDVPAVFEAAFEFANTRIRVDVLERREQGCWGLREVKSGSGVKAAYLEDIALQAYVLLGSGLQVDSVELIHIDTSYVRSGKAVAWPRLFARVDVSTDVAARIQSLPAALQAQMACLGRENEPAIEPSRHCHRPSRCEYWDHCAGQYPEDWLGWLPSLSPALYARLSGAGVQAIRDIPDEVILSPQQTRIRTVVRTGTPLVAPNLAARLAGFDLPAAYLDFEAMAPAVPLYQGTRPYQSLPFQWSLHRQEPDGTLTHDEFLAEGQEDPRRAFAESLVAALNNRSEPILVYSSFEKSRLSELASLFPDLAPAITEIISRLRDLLPVVRSSLYHPDFNFEFSIKSVAPALCPGVGYRNLGVVAGGSAAAAVFERIAADRLSVEENEDALRQALLAYCQRDTLAMVVVHRALLDLAVRQEQGLTAVGDV